MTVVSGDWFAGALNTPANFEGIVVGYDPTGAVLLNKPLLVDLGSKTESLVPLAPTLTGSQPTRTTLSHAWTSGDNSGRPGITAWQVEGRSSLDNGQNWTAWAPIAGSPFAATVFSANESGLATATPEVRFERRVRGANGDGVGQWSAVRGYQWQTVLVQIPTAMTNLGLSGRTPDTRNLAWSETADSTVIEKGVFSGASKIADIDVNALSHQLAGLTPGAQYTVTVRRRNSAGWSPDSNAVTFVQPLEADAPGTVWGPQMMGVSSSTHTHGHTEVWEGWRCYTKGARDDVANRSKTSATAPQAKFVAYSQEGTNLGGANPVYNTVLNQVKADLEAFYYNATTGAPSAREDVILFWSNGNENSVKGALGPSTRAAGSLTAADIQAYVTSQKALYDACHTLNPDNTRRYPNAYAGSNPTHNHEQRGLVAEWLHPSAIYHDFVMWSMYDPGRTDHWDDPQYTWPSLREADRTNVRLGYLIRTYYRTFQAQAYARANGKPNHKIMIGMGEGANGIQRGGDWPTRQNVPADSTTRPYWTVHAFAGGQAKLSEQYGLEQPFSCWWDNDLTMYPGTAGSDGRSMLEYDDDFAVFNGPTTREVWQNWRQYNHEYGGTHPAAWANNPKGTWRTLGAVI